eukprot:jgi/Bigna1/77642/fgenesh1_pg.49_\
MGRRNKERTAGPHGSSKVKEGGPPVVELDCVKQEKVQRLIIVFLILVMQVSPKKNNGSDESKKLGKELMEMLKQLKLEVYETEFEAQKLTKIGQLLKLYEWAPFGAIGEALGMKIGETIELYTEIQSRRHKMGLPDHNHKNDHLACCNIS